MALKFLLLSLVFFSSCSRKPFHETVILRGYTMGTTYKIKYFTPADNKLIKLTHKDEIKQKISEKLKEINRQMSTYLPHSEISTFNKLEANKSFLISDEFAKVMQTSFEIFELTQGAFDVTVGPLVNLWGFGPVRQEKKFVPTKEEVLAVKENIGTHLLTLDSKKQQLQKSKNNIYIDLSAVAKGHGVDYLANYLAEIGVENYLVEIGGEIKAKGRNLTKNSSWKVGIELPDVALIKNSIEDMNSQRVISLDDLSMATSGGYRNFFEKDGVIYSHTIDPKTGYPVKHSLVSVTVLDSLCSKADALATAFLVLGPEKGMKLANQKNIKAFFLIRNQLINTKKEDTSESGHYKVVFSYAWNQYIKESRGF